MKITFIDDHPSFRISLAELFKMKGYETSEADTLDENNLPDILVTDISMPKMNGYEVVERVAKKTSVIVLSNILHDYSVTRMVNAGARGYLAKTSYPDEIILAIKTVSEGEMYLSNEAKRMYKKQETKFTERERSYLKLTSEGLSHKDIADILFISKRTVEEYSDAVRRKLGVSKTVSVVKFAFENGLV